MIAFVSTANPWLILAVALATPVLLLAAVAIVVAWATEEGDRRDI